MNPRRLCSRAERAVQRRLARWLARRPAACRPAGPIVSFTFDDFPISAVETGAAILEAHGAAGTFYASFGLMGRTIETGRIFSPEHLPRLLQGGHELGCHTHDHCPSWDTLPDQFEASVAANRAALARLAPGLSFVTLSYPISHPRPATKRRLAARFAACRGGGQGFNRGWIDLNYLNAFFIEQSRGQPATIERLVAENARQNGWLIFATHDVAPAPTPYGCTDELFEWIVRLAVSSGAHLLTVSGALRSLGLAPAMSPSTVPVAP